MGRRLSCELKLKLLLEQRERKSSSPFGFGVCCGFSGFVSGFLFGFVDVFWTVAILLQSFLVLPFLQCLFYTFGHAFVENCVYAIPQRLGGYELLIFISTNNLPRYLPLVFSWAITAGLLRSETAWHYPFTRGCIWQQTRTAASAK